MWTLEFFAGNIVLGTSLNLFEFGCCSPSFVCNQGVNQGVTAIKLEAQLKSLKTYFHEKEDATLADIIEKIRKLPKSSKVYFSQVTTLLKI